MRLEMLLLVLLRSLFAVARELGLDLTPPPVEVGKALPQALLSKVLGGAILPLDARNPRPRFDRPARRLGAFPALRRVAPRPQPRVELRAGVRPLRHRRQPLVFTP